MDNVTATQMKDFVIVFMALAALIVLAGNLIKTIKEFRKPHDDLEEWRRDVDLKMRNDNEWLESLETGNKVISRGILALLSHEINGNSIDKLQASHQEITNYLIDR